MVCLFIYLFTINTVRFFFLCIAYILFIVKFIVTDKYALHFTGLISPIAPLHVWTSAAWNMFYYSARRPTADFAAL